MVLKSFSLKSCLFVLYVVSKISTYICEKYNPVKLTFVLGQRAELLTENRILTEDELRSILLDFWHFVSVMCCNCSTISS